MAERKRSEVVLTARAAGLSIKEGAPGVQTLKFAEGLNNDELKLMELPHEVLGALREGQRVVIRGEQSENAVLCTQDKTFDLRAADTSNALLLIPSLTYSPETCDEEISGLSDTDDNMPSKQVTMCLSSYFELRPCRPRIEKLKQLLRECPYSGPEYEVEPETVVGDEEEETEELREREEEDREAKRRKMNKDAPKKYTFSDLLDLVQASERELREALRRLQACLISGHWRLLDEDYLETAVQHILSGLDELDLAWTRVPLSSISSHLHDLLPRFVIQHCLECYGTEISYINGSTKDEFNPTETYYELSMERICQFYAILLLRQAGKFNYSEFMESWQQSVPLGMETNLEQLKRLALRDMNAMPPVIWYYPLSALPQDPVERFNSLFSARERWTQTDIEPYIEDLATPSQSLSALLLKYARVSTVKGVKMYNAKRTSTK